MIKIGNFYDILGALILTISGMYAWSKLLIKRINFGDYKTYIVLLSLTFISVINYDNVNSMIRVVVIIIFMIMFINYLFKISFKQCIVTIIFTQILNLLPELIYSAVLIYVFKINIDLNNYPEILLLGADTIVALFTAIIVNIKFTQKTYNFLYKSIDKVRFRTVLFCTLPVIFIFNAYLSIMYYKTNTFFIIFLNNVAIYIIVFVLVISLKKESDYLRINDKYSTTMNSLKEYEEMINEYRITNHENKNQLLTIRNMCTKDNIDVINYIDTVVKNNLKDNEKIMSDVSKIPEGGLRGLFYSKVLTMKDLDIDYKVCISKEIKTVDLINKIDNFTLIDICKITGVFLDNAIEEVEKLNRRNIIIEMYIENNYLLIAISNNFDKNFDINKISKRRYTSKGKGRGYGLTLVKEIINRNTRLSNEKKIFNNNFTQILKIKM